MDPPEDGVDLESLEGQEKLEKSLARSGMTLAELSGANEAPLRGDSADLRKAFDALWVRYWELKGNSEAVEAERERVVSLAKKVASWLEEPHTNLNALRLEALMLASHGKTDAAQAAITAARRMTEQQPAMLYFTLNDAAAVAANVRPKAKVAAYTARLDAARVLTNRQRAQAAYDLGYAAIGVDSSATQAAKKELRDIEAQTERKRQLRDGGVLSLQPGLARECVKCMLPARSKRLRCNAVAQRSSKSSATHCARSKLRRTCCSRDLASVLAPVSRRRGEGPRG